jgi:hypothetical protein
MMIADIIVIGDFAANAATQLCTFFDFGAPAVVPERYYPFLLRPRAAASPCERSGGAAPAQKKDLSSYLVDLPVIESTWVTASVSLEKCLNPPSLSLSTTPFSPTR